MRISLKRWAPGLALSALLCASTACTADRFVEPPIRPRAVAGDAAGDAERGLDFMLNRTYARYGIPLAASRAATSIMPLDELPPPVKGRRGLNRFLPVMSTGLKVKGVSLIQANCFTCHSGMVDGKLYLGIGNSFLDQTVDLEASPLLDPAHVARMHLREAERQELERWASYMRMMAPYTRTTSPGTSSAVSFTSFFLAHRSPGTYEWAEKPWVPVPEGVIETDIPPLWWVKRKASLYFGGEAVGNKLPHIMQFLSGPGNTLEDLETNKSNFKDVLAFMNNLQAPRYPYRIDEGKALQGKTVYESNCADCHGTYGPGGSFPEENVPIWKVGTDPVRWEASRHEGAIDHYNRLWHGQDGARMELTPGYVAPPLDGVWVTAPYLHNGSIPSLADLLEPEEKRPRFFVRGSTSRSYDPLRLGWTVEVLDHGKDQEADLEKRRRIYETTHRGKSNLGHRFGTELPADQKLALLEYMKTL